MSVLVTDLRMRLGLKLVEIERLRAVLAEIASLPPPNPAKEIAARALCRVDGGT